MIILRKTKLFVHIPSAVSEEGKEFYKEARKKLAEELRKHRKELGEVKDPALRKELRQTKLLGAKYKDEINRKAAELMK